MENKLDIRTVVNKAMRKQPLTAAELEVVNLTRDDITLPKELKEELQDSKRVYKSMKQFVHVVPVTKIKGTYVGEDDAAVTELSTFPLPDNDPKFKGIDWEVIERGSLSPVSSSLYGDTAFDLVTILEKNHGKKAVKTENKTIFSVLQEGIAPVAILTADELTNSLIVDVDPNLEKETLIVTNQDGLKKLAAFKDANGNKILKTEGTPEGPKRYFDGYPVEVFKNEELPSINGQAPLLYGAFKECVKFFEYQTMDVQVSPAPGWRKFYHMVRGIESFDVKKASNDYQYKVI